MDTVIEQSGVASAGGTVVSFGQVGQVTGGLQIGQISNYRVVGESQFYELDLDAPSAPSMADPPRAVELLALLSESHLVILAGELEDKVECARRLGYLLCRRLAAAGRSVSLRERCRGKEPQRIETAFQERETTVLLLTDISKALVAGYGPEELLDLLRRRDGYAIVTTDCTREQWEIPQGSPISRLWQDLSWESYYGGELLAAHLAHLLFTSDLEIPAGLVDESAEGAVRVGEISLREAAETLKTPERILTFVNALPSLTPPDRETVELKLSELAGDTAAIRQWYLQFSDRDQLLVVGLVLLDGLPDDLLFAGLEILVETTWRQTDPLFLHFDYRDLGRFAAYFKLTPVEGGFLRIECGSRKRRSDILQVAWNHQRRRLLATLPALIEMIRVSTSEETTAAARAEPQPSAARAAARRVLSRTRSATVQIHQVVVESLSLIGLLSVEVVEPYFLDLAVGASESVQMLVARALAVWREVGKESEFFSLLRRWWAEACEVGRQDSRIACAAGLSADPWAAVRATLAFIVGFAAQYDRENHLAPELLDLLAALASDPHPQVRDAVRKQMLPRTVAWHLRQMEELLRERVLTDEDFVVAVGRGAAEASEMRPEECQPILAAWWSEARADPRHGHRRKAMPREILLATVAAAFGHVRDSAENGLSTEELLANLLSILAEEGHPLVRRHALQGIESRTEQDPERAAQLLPDLLPSVTLEDRPQIIALAVRSYLHQRQRLEGGDRKLDVEGHSFAAWVDGPRPLTALEASLYGWLLDRSRPGAQQLAVRIFAAFAGTPLEREEKRLRDLLSPGPESARVVGSARTRGPDIQKLTPFGHLAVYLATPRREELWPLLQPLMAEIVVEHRRKAALAVSRRGKDHRSRVGRIRDALRAATYWDSEGSNRIEDLLARWSGVSNASARTLTDHLQRAVQWYRWRWRIVATLGLQLIGLSFLYRPLARPMELFAEQIVPSPVVPEDLMAPLAPGFPVAPGLRIPYCLRFTYRKNDQSRATELPSPDVTEEAMASLQAYLQGARISDLPSVVAQVKSPSRWMQLPHPAILDDLAAPLPPGTEPDAALACRRRLQPLQGTTPREIAWSWEKSILPANLPPS